MLPWQQHSRCNSRSVPFVMYISGAKFEEHCFNISGDILDWVLYCFNLTTYDVNTILICIIQNVNISKNKKDTPKRKTLFFFTLKSLSNKQQLFFTSLALNSSVKNKRQHDFWEKGVKNSSRPDTWDRRKSSLCLSLSFDHFRLQGNWILQAMYFCKAIATVSRHLHFFFR